ncbi:hypothetical protein TrispH2_011887 [Trichoplax sp. H2]|nr:hypothetical protein TrispH2_011887 [Trichoplax sp. H2]|eukprot:RDD35848.1 hypothetical protein TrispH2_011887 [Trichoplax sp. H2]
MILYLLDLTVDASSNNGEDIPMSLTEEERASTIPKYKISRIGMLEIHKHILRSHYVEIIEECKSSVKPICNHLYSREILTHYLKEFIVCQPTDYEKMGKLLDILPECGNRAYGVFCEVLSTINSPVIGILENAERENEEESKGNYNVKDADNLTSQNQATSSRTKASKKRAASSTHTTDSLVQQVKKNRISFSSSNKQVKSTLPDDITPKQIEPVNTGIQNIHIQ